MIMMMMVVCMVMGTTDGPMMHYVESAAFAKIQVAIDIDGNISNHQSIRRYALEV